MFKPGSIRKIHVKNFVTYTNTEFYPGPNLNMIIGPNGTGKSTMVAAIILGLGGNPKIVGRGTRVSEYVKHGCTNAEIIIFLQEDVKDKYTKITRAFDCHEKSHWSINNQRVTVKEVFEYIKQFNIQVNNLCQFLPQDRVADFAKLNKIQLLRETKIALCREDLIKKQDDLVQSREREKALIVNVEKQQLKLQEARDANSRLEGKVTNFNMKRKYLDQIQDIDRKVAWIQYEELRDKLSEKKEDKNKATAIYEKYRNAAQPAEKQIAAAKSEVTKLQNNSMNITRTIRAAETKINSKLEAKEKIKLSINEVKENMRIKISEIDQTEREIQLTMEKIEEMRITQVELVNTCGQDAEVKQKVENITASVHKLTTHLRSLEDKKERISSDKHTHIAQLRAMENEVLRLENVKQKRLDALRRIDNDAYEAVLWLRNNTHLFKAQVYEPIMMEINVLDPRNGVYLENVIARRDRVAFTCLDKDDMNLLIKSLRETKRLGVNILHSSATESVEFRPSVPIEQLRRYGFHTYLQSLFTAPAPIMNYLCKTYQVHNIPIGDAKTNSCFDGVPPQIRLFFSDKFRYSINVSRYSNEKSTNQAEIQGDGTLSISVDILRLENLQGQVVGLQRNIENCNGQIREFESQIMKVNEKVAELRNELKTVRTLKHRAEGIASRISTMQTKISEMRQRNKNADAIKAEAAKKIQEIIARMVPIEQEIADSLTHYCSLFPQQELNGIKIDIALKKITYLENEALETKQKCQEAEELLRVVKEEYSFILRQAKTALNNAKALSNGFAPDEEGFSELREVYDRLSSDLMELQNAKDQLQSKIDCLNTADNTEIQEYESTLELIKRLQNDLETNNLDLNKLNSKMEQLKESWLVPLQELVSKINEKFRQSFARMACAGEVSIDTGDNDKDFDKYGLSIKVTFRSGVPLQQLNSSVQSGGERAVATAVFMLSLQDLTPVPFRCVDEINQGMDATNERRIFDLIVTSTSDVYASQYFLITPKLVPNLNYSGNMMIHVIHNGPFIPPDRKWMSSDLCNPQKLIIN